MPAPPPRGQRGVNMHKVINGKRYNTDTASKMAMYDQRYENRNTWFQEILYRKKTGEYFLYCRGSNDSTYPEDEIIPKSITSSKAWAEKRLTGDEYEAIFGGIVEDENGDKQQYSFWLPLKIYDNLKEISENSNTSISSLIISALRKAGY